MVSKRTYKALTSKQTAKVKKYTKAGKSQQVIAKLLGVSKQRVATSQKKAQVGKRVSSGFWKDVKAYRKISGDTHREATEVMKYSRKWKKAYKKRTGKARTSQKDKDRIRAMLREEYLRLEEEQKMGGIDYEGEKYFDTPH